MKKRMRTRRLLLMGLAGVGLLAGPAWAAETEKDLVEPPTEVAAKPTAEAFVGLYSKYVWRGIEYSKDSLVIQPALTVGYQGFSANFWSNVDTDVHDDIRDETDPTLSDGFNLNETDVTLAYDWAMGLAGFSAGYIYYDLDGVADSQEVFLSAGLDTLLNPTLTVYREIAHAPGWYVTFDVSHSLPITGNLALDLGAKVSYWSFNDKDDAADPDDPNDEFSDFHDATLSASMTFPINEYVSITPELYYSFALSDAAEKRIQDLNLASDDDSYLYGGVSATLSF